MRIHLCGVRGSTPAPGREFLRYGGHTSHEKAAEAVFGHAAAEYAVGLGRRADVLRVMLTHHNPDRTDDELDELAPRFATGTPAVIVAAEGGILDL